MPKKVSCCRKTVKQCKHASKSCTYVKTKKSRYCRTQKRSNKKSLRS